MSDPRIVTKPQAARPTPAGATRPTAAAGPPAKPKPAGDSLQLSPAARERQAPGHQGPGTNVRVETTDRDVTVGAQLGEKTRVVARHVTASPTMLDGATLMKLERDLGTTTTAFVGVGDMPGFYSRSIGPNRRVDMPHQAVFAGIEDVRGARKSLGHGLELDMRLHSLAVGTLGFNRTTGVIDGATSAGLSKGTVTGEVDLTRRFGPLAASLGYGHHLDVGHMGSYWLMGGSGLPPRTHWLSGGLGTRAAGVDLRLDGYVPLETASNDFSNQAKLRASAGGHRFLPEVGATVSREGLERIDAIKGIELAKGLEATAAVSAWRPLSAKPEVMGGLGLRWTPGGGGSRRPATRRPDDWRAQAPTPRRAGEIRVAQPRLSTWFSPAEIEAMRGKSVEELARVLKTPEQVVAYLDRFVRYDDQRLRDPKGDYGSLRPNEVATLLKGVCRDQHPFMLAVMKEGGGVQGRQIGYSSPDTSHAIAVYRDPASGKWNVIEYGRIHYTEARSAEEAFEAVRPDALVYADWSQGGPNDKNHQRTIRYSETAREWYRFVQPSRN